MWGDSRRFQNADLQTFSSPPVVPPPGGNRWLYRDSWHVLAPSFDANGWSNPVQLKERPDGVTGRTIWGRYRILISAGDRTFFRGVESRVLKWSHSSPFGPETCTIRFPQITPFEKLGVDIPWLHDHARAHLQKVVDDDGTIDPDWHWIGIKHSAHLSWTEDGWARDVEFKGFLHQGSDGNNRPTFPAGGQFAHDVGYRIPHRLNQLVGRKYTAIPRKETGILVYKKGSLDATVLGFVSDLLAIAWTVDGLQWSLMDRPGRPWQSHLVLPDPDTVDYTLPLGLEGLELELDEDYDELPNVVFAEWVTPDGARTQNLKYPNLRPDATPDFPLSLGASFAPGDGHAGFGPFAEWLDSNGYTIYSGDTYDTRDEDEVIDAQQRMGVTDDGLVNATTWGTAFTHNARDAFRDAVYLPIAWDKRVEPYLYSTDGVLLGPNPDYDPSISRRETFINFGENVHRHDVLASARQIVALSKKRSLVGTIRTTSDPEQCSLREIRAGKTLAVPYLDGAGATGVKFHVAHVEVTEGDDGDGTAEMTVDTLWRDRWTVEQIIERNKEARHNPGRMRRQNAAGLTQDTKPVFDRDNGAGRLYKHQLDAGVWRVLPFPASAWGTFVRVHAETDPITKFAMVLFADKVTSNFCERNIGDPLSSEHPYKPNASALKDAGLIQAWGSSTQPCGYSKPGAADGYLSDDDPLTGIFEWDSPQSYWSERIPLLWLAEYSPNNTAIKVRFYNQPVDF